MLRMPASDARREFSRTINRVAYGGERIVLSRHERDVVALVPVEDLELIRAIEDKVDLADARASLAEGGRPRDMLDGAAVAPRTGPGVQPAPARAARCGPRMRRTCCAAGGRTRASVARRVRPGHQTRRLGRRRNPSIQAFGKIRHRN